MLPDDLTTFLAIYAHPAAVIARGAVQFENAPFRASREACGDLLLEKLCAAVAASSRRAVTRFHAAGAASGTIVWSLTHQRDLRDPELRRTVVLAQDTLIGGEEAASGHLDPERPLRGDRWWLAEPRFKGISTGGGVMGDMIRSWDWVRIPVSLILQLLKAGKYTGFDASWPDAYVEPCSNHHCRDDFAK